MSLDREVILQWSNKRKDVTDERDVLVSNTSEVYPAPLLQMNSLFEPIMASVQMQEKQPDNRLIQGDNLDALYLLRQQGYAGKINLIYLDPPYLSESNYLSRVLLVENQSQQWLERPVFKDSYQSDLASYLSEVYPRLVLMRDLLAENGSLLVHLDWHACHYVKVIMDEIFGQTSFINEIVWCYGGGSGSRRHFHRKHDIILWYAKGQDYTFNPQYRSYSQGTLQRGLTKVKGDKYHLHEEGALLQDWWTDINKILSPTAHENLKFPTQKPKALLRRLVAFASNPGDLVADFYAGSGTMPQVCEEMGRSWLACDNNNIAVQTTIYRLIETQARPFRWEELNQYESGEGGKVSPCLMLKPPRLYTGGQDYNWLELGIEDYKPGQDNADWLNRGYSWPILIDFWEVDLNYQEDVFHSCLQMIRPQRRYYDKTLPLEIRIRIPLASVYRLALRVHDVFGQHSQQVVEIRA